MQFDKPTGKEQLDELGGGYHARLAENWPAPRGQLHHGGWETTNILMDKLNFSDTGKVVLDVCCGEGETTEHVAATYGATAFGIDLAHSAVAYAAHHHKQAAFLCGNIFEMPFASETFDIIYGQDPDGFAHYARFHALEESFRLLKPGGEFAIHHWILDDNLPSEWNARFEAANADMGFDSVKRMKFDEYVHDIETAGFDVVETLDWRTYYQTHLEGVRDIKQKNSLTIDPFTLLILDIIGAGYAVGYFIHAKKPT